MDLSPSDSFRNAEDKGCGLSFRVLLAKEAILLVVMERATLRTLLVPLLAGQLRLIPIISEMTRYVIFSFFPYDASTPAGQRSEPMRGRAPFLLDDSRSGY